MIDRAFKIKEDVIDSLNFTHGTWNEEKQARGLLQEHIRTITAVVNRLNGDIAVSLSVSPFICGISFYKTFHHLFEVDLPAYCSSHNPFSREHNFIGFDEFPSLVSY